MKIASVVGARPQFIKAATVTREIITNNRNDPHSTIREVMIHTGQHYDKNMSEVFFRELGIPDPAYNLGVGSCSHAKQTAQMLEKIEAILIKEIPDCVVVYGDTNSTLAGALTAAKLHIPVAHVESGLRSFNQRMPEEINRVLTDHVSEMLFCPTRTAVENLANEGITKGVYHVGDVNYDSALYFAAKSEAMEKALLGKLHIKPGAFYLATVHRAENTDDRGRLTNILEALDEIATSDCPLILPLHPRTAACMKNYGLVLNNVTSIPPVSYLEMITLERQAKAILTDSGGIQKEAFWFRVPCITLRDETEWIETVASGWNALAGADKGRIIGTVNSLRTPVCEAEPIYGDGSAARKILDNLKNRFWNGPRRPKAGQN